MIQEHLQPQPHRLYACSALLALSTQIQLRLHVQHVLKARTRTLQEQNFAHLAVLEQPIPTQAAQLLALVYRVQQASTSTELGRQSACRAQSVPTLVQGQMFAYRVLPGHMSQP